MTTKLLSIEWTRLNRRVIFWLTLLFCGLFIIYAQQNFYTSNITQLMDGGLKMPGFSFDLASSLDQINLIGMPLLLIVTSLTMGNDYSHRTNHHWLMRITRHSSLLTKFFLLVLLTLAIQVLALVVGGAVGWYFKTFTYEAFTFANVNWSAALVAPFYMTLVMLPYIALGLLITIVTRSTFWGIAIGLGYTQIVEIIFGSLLYGSSLMRWMPRNLYLSATFMLNEIGNRSGSIPDYMTIFSPDIAFIIAAFYTVILLSIALWAYHRQDAGG